MSEWQTDNSDESQTDSSEPIEPSEPESVKLVLVMDYIPERLMFHWDIEPFINHHLFDLTVGGIHQNFYFEIVEKKGFHFS